MMKAYRVYIQNLSESNNIFIHFVDIAMLKRRYQRILIRDKLQISVKHGY